MKKESNNNNLSIFRDISNLPVKREENRGHYRKYWIEIQDKDNPNETKNALFKESKRRESDSTDYELTHYGEYIYYLISKKIGFPCAKIEIVQKDGKLGILSYNVLEDIDKQNQDKTGRYILVDFATLIQGIRNDFDATNLIVPSTGEHYSIDLILDAVGKRVNLTCKENEQKETQNESEEKYKELYKKIEKNIVSLCIVDSLLYCEDRHSLNGAVRI